MRRNGPENESGPKRPFELHDAGEGRWIMRESGDGVFRAIKKRFARSQFDRIRVERVARGRARDLRARHAFAVVRTGRVGEGPQPRPHLFIPGYAEQKHAKRREKGFSIGFAEK